MVSLLGKEKKGEKDEWRGEKKRKKREKGREEDGRKGEKKEESIGQYIDSNSHKASNSMTMLILLN
jgi:hypothetical protein